MSRARFRTHVITSQKYNARRRKVQLLKKKSREKFFMYGTMTIDVEGCR
jgi:hypothetical protein